MGSTTGGTFTVTPPSAEYLGTVTAAQVASGLGFNLTTSNDWEWQTAKAAGATFGRIQCSWVSTEIQAAPPADTSSGYSLQTDCGAALTSALSYGIQPTIVAAYGAPYHQILTITVPAGASSGATSVDIVFSAGIGGSAISSMRSIWNLLYKPTGNKILSPLHDYGGTIITNVNVTSSTTATLTLASGLTSSLPADSTPYWINEYLYIPAATASSSLAANLAYANYAQYLAQQIAAKGLSGGVELWNEPPWGDSCWDNYTDCGGSGGTIGSGVANQGFAAAVQNLSQSTNVAYLWAGTNKSGDNTLLNGKMLSASGVALAQPSVKISSESLHPYGNNPENSVWSAPCLNAAAVAGGANSTYKFACNLFGVAGGNGAEGAAYDAVAKFANAASGLTHSITETGFDNSQGTQAQGARYILRQFLGYQAAGVTPVEFYRLYDTAQNFGFGTFTSGHFVPYQQYTSLQALMADVSAIKLAPVAAVSSTSLIASSSGLTWPLDSVQIVGAAHGNDSINSVMLAAWQRTYSNTAASQADWASVTSPTGGSMTVNIPSGTSVAKAINVTTQVPITYTAGSNQITLAVADDPVEILFEPSITPTQHNLGNFNGRFN